MSEHKFSTFSEAAAYAKELATTSGVTVNIVRNSDYFVVVVRETVGGPFQTDKRKSQEKRDEANMRRARNKRYDAVRKMKEEQDIRRSIERFKADEQERRKRVESLEKPWSGGYGLGLPIGTRRKQLSDASNNTEYGISRAGEVTKSMCPVCGGDGGAKGECYKCGGTGWA